MIKAPDLSGASMTMVAIESPLIILFLCGKFVFLGSSFSSYSVRMSPVCSISRARAMFCAG